MKEIASKLHPEDLIAQSKIVGIYNPPPNNAGLKNLTKSLTSKMSPLLNTNTTAFLVVRHPFERLVSAFRDKLERTHGNNSFYYQTYGKSMVHQFRNKAVEIFGSTFFSSSNNFGAIVPVPNDRRPDAKLPTFWEFVQYLLHPEIPVGMDEHWTPMYYYCSICQKSQLAVYNYILKFEELDVEQPAFLKHLLKTSTIRNTQHVNNNRPQGISSHEITKLYFSVLSDSDIEGLYKLYKPDFLLFNYHFLRGDLVIPPSTTRMHA